MALDATLMVTTVTMATFSVTTFVAALMQVEGILSLRVWGALVNRDASLLFDALIHSKIALHRLIRIRRNFISELRW